MKFTLTILISIFCLFGLNSCQKSALLQLQSQCNLTINGEPLCGTWNRTLTYKNVTNIDSLIDITQTEPGNWIFDNSNIKLSDNDPDVTFLLESDTIYFNDSNESRFKLRISSDTLLAFDYINYQAYLYLREN